MARRLFSDEVIEAHLDHLLAAQRPDGGWTVNFPAWTEAAGRNGGPTSPSTTSASCAPTAASERPGPPFIAPFDRQVGPADGGTEAA